MLSDSDSVSLRECVGQLGVPKGHSVQGSILDIITRRVWLAKVLVSPWSYSEMGRWTGGMARTSTASRRSESSKYDSNVNS